MRGRRGRVRLLEACPPAAGIFLFVGLVGGILKYRGIMNSPNHRAHPYIDIAHRAALLYSVAAVVMAALLTFSPYSDGVQLVITGELAGVGAIVWGFIYTQFLG